MSGIRWYDGGGGQPFSSSSEMQVRPDWVIVGTQWSEDQVAIYASRSLVIASLSYKADWEALDGFWWRLEVVLGRGTDGKAFVIITGPDYATCMRQLMQTWSPEEDEPPMLKES